MVESSTGIELLLYGTATEDREPLEILPLETLFISAFHGDEPFSADLLKRFITTLDEQWPVDIDPKTRFGVIPVLNQDGLTHNRRTNERLVDLNRNFPTQNWIEENPDTPYYSGLSAGSEAETQFLMEVIETYRPQKIISIHTPYRVINYDGPALGLAEAMARHNRYPVTADIGYPTPGSFGTYCGVERDIATITLELPEDEPFETIWEDNYPALLAALQYTLA